MTAAYMVSRAGSVLFHTRLLGLWKRVPGRRKKTMVRKIYDPPRKLYRRVKEAEDDGLSDTGRIGILFNEIEASRSGEALPESVSMQPSLNPKREVESASSYRDRFLVNDGVRSRVTTAIDRDIHKKMKKLLVLVAPEVTVVSYISNVLVHHLEQFSDEIDELYRHETEKPL
jgi:hypothetical protein